MSYKEIKQLGIHYSEHRKEYEGMKIEEQDMQTLDKYRQNTLLMPLIAGIGLFGFRIFLNHVRLPDILDNPL